jgi:hypothetical protein
LVFYLVFLAELILKIVGSGYRSYFVDRSNVFDFVIVFLSTFDVALFIWEQTTKDIGDHVENNLNVGTVS